MIPKGIKILLFVTFAGLISCTKAFNFRTEAPQMVKVDELPADFKMPAKVWEIVEKDPELKPGAETPSLAIFTLPSKFT